MWSIAGRSVIVSRKKIRRCMRMAIREKLRTSRGNGNGESCTGTTKLTKTAKAKVAAAAAVAVATRVSCSSRLGAHSRNSQRVEGGGGALRRDVVAAGTGERRHSRASLHQTRRRTSEVHRPADDGPRPVCAQKPTRARTVVPSLKGGRSVGERDARRLSPGVFAALRLCGSAVRRVAELGTRGLHGRSLQQSGSAPDIQPAGRPSSWPRMVTRRDRLSVPTTPLAYITPGRGRLR